MTREEIHREFEEWYEKLVDEEENFRYLVTVYGVGEEKIYVCHLDESFKRIKTCLKNIRTLALNIKKLESGEKHDDDTPSE